MSGEPRARRYSERVPRGSRPPASPLARRIAHLLRDELKAAGISQGTAGAALGESQTQTGRYLRGEVTLNVDQIVALCKLVDLDPHELLRRVGGSDH